MKKEFKKGEVLMAADLQEMADAITALEVGGTEVLPRSGCRSGTPGMAYYECPPEEAKEVPEADEGETLNAAGLICGVEYTAVVTSPRINAGVIQLPPVGGGGACNCGPAYYDRADGSCIGLVRSIEFDLGQEEPRINDGDIVLPGAHMNGGCSGVVGGVAKIEYCSGVTEPCILHGIIQLPPPVEGLRGLVTVDGLKTWEELACAGVVRLHDGDVTTLGVSAEVVSGYLNIFVDRQ